MRCTDTKAFIDSWEREGTVSAEQLDAVQQHIGECGRCASRYRNLLPLIVRDAGVHVEFGVDEVASDSSVAPLVMERIRNEKPRSNAYRKARPGLIAAAAVLIAVLGFTTYYAAYLRPTVLVQFTLEAPSADSVHLVGDFNGWDTGAITLRDDDSDGVWSARVRLKRDEIHMYNFVIDGETWIADPESLFNVDDGFGGRNSMIKL